MLRRTKSMLVQSGILSLPPLTEITVLVLFLLPGFHVALVALRELPMLLAFSSKAPNHQSLQNIVMQLRKTCSHPYLFPGIEPEPYVEGEHLVQAVPPYELPALTKGYLFPLDYKLARPPEYMHESASESETEIIISVSDSVANQKRNQRRK
ncbi:hypothetical protein Scep_017414 [Stephania cephalantha]|uniref:Uncharacterized protein n=1 Tax=Stephania cephalantha TaxID=152367 RepID=A0AAP0NWW9_9MAGN